MVISGGVKVPAHAVESMLVQHPEVESAFVVGVPDDEWGERVVALVVVDDRVPPLVELRDLVRPREWAPRSAIGLREVPLLPSGKPDREAMRKLAADA